MADLQIPQNINAKKLIKDASVLGIGVLSDSQEASIYQAERDIRSAQGDVRTANGKVNEAEGQQRSAEAESDKAEARQRDGESDSNSAPTESSVKGKANDANSIMTTSKSRSQAMTTAGQSLGQANSVFGNMMGSTSSRIEGFSVEITSITADNQALMADNQSLRQQIQQENSFDGTGAGTSSAYSLSTGAEVQEQQLQNPQPAISSQSGELQARIDANNAKIEANGAKADELTQQAQGEQQTFENQRVEATQRVQEQQQAATEAQDDSNAEKSTLQTIGEYAQTASNVGGMIDSVGDVVKVAGIGVTAAGGALTATGGAVGVTGATITGIGAAITTVGAPLCALFGIGVPIVGAGGTTTGSGVATGSVGTGVAGSGTGLIGTGQTIEKVGNGISMVGNGIKVAGDATTAGVKIAEGDVMGALQASANAISSAAAFSSTITSSDSMKGVFDKVYNGASAVREGIATYQSAENGDVAGAIAHGVSTFGFGVGASDYKFKQSVSDFANGISAGTGAVQSAMDGDYANAAIQGTQALFNFASGVGNYKLTKAMDALASGTERPDDSLIEAMEDADDDNTTAVRHSDSMGEDLDPDDFDWDALIDAGEGTDPGRVYYTHDGISASQDADTPVIISHEDADMLHGKTKKLLGKGADSEFGEGIEALQARMLAEGARDAQGIQHMNEGGGDARVRDWSGGYRIGIDAETTQDAADLAQFAYDTKGKQAPNGWHQVDTQSADNGFHAKAFEKDGKVIIAFRGSDDMGDLRVDHQMLSGNMPDQFHDATDFVRRVRQSHPDAEIIVTGHSLGGALTELTASQFPDVKGVTFDAVGTRGLVESHGLTDHGNTVNYVVRGDIISNASEHVGTTVVVDGVRGHDEHAIQNFTGDNNALVGTEGGMASVDSRRRAQTEQSRARKGNTLDAAIDNANGGVVRFTDKKQFREVRNQFEIDANTLNADLDRLQRQVNHVADPQQRAELNRILETRRRTLREDCDIARHSRVVSTMTGDQTNDYLRDKHGFENPAFLPGQTPDVQTVELTRETRFVRVFNEEGNPPSYAKGVWVMALSDIEGLTPAQIKDKFALPGMPSHVVELELPAGTQLITGPCNPLEGWGNGGGTQYFITGEKSHKYSNIRNLPPNP